MKDKEFEDNNEFFLRKRTIKSFKINSGEIKLSKKQLLDMIKEFDEEDELMNEWNKSRQNGTG